MRMPLALILLVTLAACGDDPGAEVDFGGEDVGPDRYSVLSEDGEVKLGLTDEWVYFALSDSMLAEIRTGIEGDTADEGLKGMIGGLVKKGVGRALGFRAKYAVDEVEDVRWEDGELRLVFTDPDRRFETNMEVDDRPVTEAFSRDAVESFAAEFRRVKERRPGP